MSDRETHEGFEDPDEDEPELILMAPEEKEAAEKAAGEAANAGKITITSAEYEALKRAGESGEAVRSGLEGLAGRLRPVNAPAPAVPAGESEEEFERRIEKDLFENGKTSKTLKEAVIRTVGPVLQQILGMSAEQMKRVLAVDPEKGETFRKYRQEIEEEYAAMPPVEKLMVTGYDKAMERVVARHGPELDQIRIDTAVAARLKELGIEPGAKPKIPAPVNAGEGAGPTGVQSGRRKISLVMGADERAKLEAKAEASGMEFVDYLRATGRIKE